MPVLLPSSRQASRNANERTSEGWEDQWESRPAASRLIGTIYTFPNLKIDFPAIECSRANGEIEESGPKEVGLRYHLVKVT